MDDTPHAGTSEIKQKLAESLQITGIPALIVLGAKTGHFIFDNARSEVLSVHKDDEKCKELIQKGKDTEAVPITEAQLSGSSPDKVNYVSFL